MKELTIEEKAKAYDEAIERAKVAYKDEDRHLKATLERIFDVLKESEDEKIRKSLLEYLHTLPNYYAHSGVCAPEWIDWLEKQGKQKPIIEMKTPEESLGIDSDTYNKIVDECVYGEQNHAWSEEDGKQARQIERIVHNAGCTQKCQERIADWLKSLKDRCTWRPSDEQMDALRYVTNFDYGGYKATLVSLYEQLKKLKE